MKHNITLFTVFAFCIFTCACGEDAELLKKHGEQEAEIAKLKGELSLIEERLKYLPADQSAELEAAELESRKLEAEQKELTDEVANLEADYKALKEQYENYQRKYVVR